MLRRSETIHPPQRQTFLEFVILLISAPETKAAAGAEKPA